MVSVGEQTLLVLYFFSPIRISAKCYILFDHEQLVTAHYKITLINAMEYWECASIQCSPNTYCHNSLSSRFLRSVKHRSWRGKEKKNWFKFCHVPNETGEVWVVGGGGVPLCVDAAFSKGNQSRVVVSGPVINNSREMGPLTICQLLLHISPIYHHTYTNEITT